MLEDEDDAEDNDEEQEDEDDDEDGDGSKRKGTEGEATSTTTTEEQARGEEGEGEVEQVSDSDDDSSTFLYQFVNSIIRLVYSAPSKTDEDTEEASVARVARHAASPGPESTANNEKNKTMWATNSLVDNQGNGDAPPLSCSSLSYTPSSLIYLPSRLHLPSLISPSLICPPHHLQRRFPCCFCATQRSSVCLYSSPSICHSK